MTGRVPRPGAALRLFCFPHAGGGAVAFRDWVRHLPEAVELCPVQLPGRETRLQEPPFGRIAPLVAAACEALLPYLDRPFAFYGHSMGALVSFELARRLRRVGRKLPEMLLVSGRAAPHLPPDRRSLHELPEAELLAELRDLDGTPAEVLDSRELMELMLPTLRADFAVCETYTFSPDAPLSCPIVAFGAADDPEVGRERLAGWGLHTTESFELEILRGGHFFPYSTESGFLNSLSWRLEAALAELGSLRGADAR